MTIAETARRGLQAPAIDLPAVFFFAGVIVCFFGAAMLLPAIVDLAQDDDDYRVFVMCSAITMFGGLSLVLAFRQRRYAVGVREVMLLVPATWIAVVAFSALPFAFSSFPLSYTDAVFEAMSGIAAVGSTVIIGLDTAPMGILLWRCWSCHSCGSAACSFSSWISRPRRVSLCRGCPTWSSRSGWSMSA